MFHLLLEGRRVEFGKKLTLLHLCVVVDIELFDDAADLGTDLDLIYGLYLARGGNGVFNGAGGGGLGVYNGFIFTRFAKNDGGNNGQHYNGDKNPNPVFFLFHIGC